MMDLEPLNHAMILRYLDAEDAVYEIGGDGTVSFEYDPEPGSGRTLTVNLSIVREHWYFVQITADRIFLRGEWDQAVWMCNAWNGKEMYPTAYLLPDPEFPDEADIFLEHTVILRFGVTQQQLEDVTEEVIGLAFTFWDWAHSEHGV